MKSVEATGKTIEEAKQKATAKLGVSESDIEFEVLDIGAKGLFGLLGGAPARVRATYYETQRHRLSSTQASPRVGSPIKENEEADTNRGRRKSQRSNRSDRQDQGDRQPQERTSQRGRSDSKDRRERPSDRNQPSDREQPAPASQSSERPSRSRDARPRPTRSQESSRRAPDHTQTAFDGNKDSSRPIGQDEPARNPRPARPSGRSSSARSDRRASSSPAGTSESRPDFQPERSGQRQGAEKMTAGLKERSDEALKYVQSILDAGELSAQAQISQTANGSADADALDIDIDGGRSELLIGRQGQGLDALQFLVGIALNRKYENKLRLTLDAAGFRRRHREALEQTALDLAAQVIEHQQEAELEPLPARDRRIIHNILKDHPDVYTYSEGDGDDRHVIISPKEAE